LSDLQFDDYSYGRIRAEMKKLSDNGQIKRYDEGIYFIPRKSIFKSGSQLSLIEVISSKYFQNGEEICGYMSGLDFANQLGLTTQVPVKKEIVTNKATKDYRETKLATSLIIIRKPRVFVTTENYKALQFLDLIKDIDFFSEETGLILQEKLQIYMQKANIRFEDLALYLDYYPERIYKNLYKVGLLNGIFTS